LTDVRRVDARSAQICRRAGVIRTFQVSEYSIEPSQGSSACNLLAKDCCRTALLNERKPRRPEVPRILFRFPLSSVTERLAGTRAGPDWFMVGDSCEAEGEAPAADAGEEVALCESIKVSRIEVFDAPLVYDAGSDMAGGD
jgi:hypothetical protein